MSLPEPEYRDEPIAVIGLDCIFPGAPNAKVFWENILNGVSAVGDPLPAWNAELYLDERGATSTQKGGYLKDLYRFNPVEFGIMPSSMDGGEPDQFLALAIAARTLADAGYGGDGADHRDTGVIIGHSPYYHRGQINTAQHHVFVEQTREMIRAMIPSMTAGQEVELERLLKDQLPAFNADISPGLVPNVLTGRIANRLNLRGPNYMVDAACASSLLAIGSAIDELRAGRSRMMLAGGVNASLPPEVAIIFTQLDALSTRGAVRPFSAQADGTLLGEGLGLVALKRRADALADGDRIYALLHGVGQSSDGKGLGLLTPSSAGEVLAMRRAYDATGVDPSTIGLIEAHGTGIRLGDRTEVGAMREIFGDRAGAEGHVAVGSVKSMISHTIPAAGVASVIKTSLALHHKILPPSLCEEVEPELGIEQTALYVNTAARPWIHAGETPRRAGVNAFGFGGVNAHAVLEEAPETAAQPANWAPWSAELCVFASDSAAGLTPQLDRVEAFLAARPDATLAQVARALWAELGHGAHRLSITARDTGDLLKKMSQARKKLARGGRFVTRTGIAGADAPLGGKLAFMFPGEGSQYLHMLADLAQHFGGVRQWLDFWMEMGQGGEPRTDIVYPRESELTEAKHAALTERLFSMGVGSEASFVAGQAMFACLRDLGVTPDAMVGHSSGENAALLAAGVVRADSAEDLSDGFRKITRISRDIEAKGDVPTGALIAVGLIDKPVITAALADLEAVIAMENCQQQTILFTSHDAKEAVIAALTGAGGVCEVLPFDRGYHTPAFAPMQKAFEAFYSDIGVHAPTVPLYSCASAAEFPSGTAEVTQLAAAQWSQKVRFIETLGAMHDDGVRAFVEVGAGGKLTAFAEQILAGKKAEGLLIAPSNLAGTSGLSVLLQLMGQLFVAGHAQLDRLFGDREIMLVDLDDLKVPKAKGMFLDNSIPKITATPELTTFLQSLSPVAQPAPAPSAGPLPPSGNYPFLTRILQASDDALEAEVALDAACDLYLQDHVLSGPVSDDPDLMGLPCVPLMASLEIMAEAAAALLGRRDLCVVEALQGTRWLTLEDTRDVLRVRAKRLGAAGAEVEILADGTRAVSVRLSFGTIAPPAEALPQVIPEATYCAPGPYETYAEHIFHGPVFQSIEYVTAWSQTGIEATLSDVTLEGFFRAGETPELILNPVLMDALTQVSAFWLAQEIGPHFASFPRIVPRIEIYAHIGAACDDLWLRGQRSGRLGGGQDGTWDVACYHDEFPVLRMTGLQNAFNMLPQPYYYYSLEPINGWMGYPLEVVNETTVTWEMPQLPASFLKSVGGVFLRVLGFSSLTAEERVTFTAFGDDLDARAAWLMPRVAAKEAVRWLVNQLTVQRLHSADIPLQELPNGALSAGLPWLGLGEMIIEVGVTPSGAITARAVLSPPIDNGQQNAAHNDMETNA